MNHKSTWFIGALYFLFILQLFSLNAYASALSAVEIYKKANNSVYLLIGTKKDEPSHRGSAVAISNDVLASNCHVVLGGERIYVIENGKVYSAFVFHHDRDRDLCLFMAPTLALSPAKLRKFNDLEIGEDVYAIGNPRGSHKSLSKGIISNKISTENLKIIQTDLSTASGSSGGGLFDQEARLIGITTSGEDSQGDTSYSISTDLILEAMPTLVEKQTDADDSVVEDKKIEQTAENYKPSANETNEKQTSAIQQIGVYGVDNIGLYRFKNNCGIHMNGILHSGRKYASVLWDPEDPNFLMVFPSVTEFSDIPELVAEYKTYPYKRSYSYVVIRDQLYELYGNHDAKDRFYILAVEFNSSLQSMLAGGEYFLVQLKSRDKYIEIRIGLYGFSEAYKAYLENCKQF